MVVLFTACSSRVVRPSGLSYAKVGSPMPKVGVKKIKGHAVRDSIFEDEDFSWRVAILNYSKGKVFLEQDFNGAERINRIRIETPELKTQQGITVGQTIADLNAITGSWYVHPLPKFNVFDFYSELMPRVHFVVSEPGRDMSDLDWEKYPISSFKPESKIVSIVVF